MTINIIRQPHICGAMTYNYKENRVAHKYISLFLEKNPTNDWQEYDMKITTHGFVIILPESKTTVSDICEYVASLSANPHGKYFVASSDFSR